MSLNRANVPEAARALVPWAERWGIGDDFDREAALSAATERELEELGGLLDDVSDDFWDWLAGPASFDPVPSDEYAAMTALTMAVDSARVKLDHGA
jgi:hypothetical protein